MPQTNLPRLCKRLALSLLSFGVVTGLAGSASAASMLPPCEADQLSLMLVDRSNGHDSEAGSSARLVVRNHSGAGCRIPGLPPIGFRDRDGHVLPIERQIPPGMHPGPAIPPASLPPGVSLDARLGWHPIGTFPKARCYSPTAIEMTISGHAVTQPFYGSLCASRGPPVTFTQSWFRWRPMMNTTR